MGSPPLIDTGDHSRPPLLSNGKLCQCRNIADPVPGVYNGRMGHDYKNCQASECALCEAYEDGRRAKGWEIAAKRGKEVRDAVAGVVASKESRRLARWPVPGPTCGQEVGQECVSGRGLRLPAGHSDRVLAIEALAHDDDKRRPPLARF